MDSTGVMVAHRTAYLFGRMPGSTSRQFSCFSTGWKIHCGLCIYFSACTAHREIYGNPPSLLSCFSQAFPHIRTQIFLIGHHIPGVQMCCIRTPGGGSLLGTTAVGHGRNCQFRPWITGIQTYSLSTLPLTLSLKVHLVLLQLRSYFCSFWHQFH